MIHIMLRVRVDAGSQAGVNMSLGSIVCLTVAVPRYTSCRNSHGVACRVRGLGYTLVSKLASS